MNKVTIATDNIFTEIALSTLVSNLGYEPVPGGRFAIFAFENGWFSRNDSEAIVNCEAERVVVLGKKTALTILSECHSSRKIAFGDYEQSPNDLNYFLDLFFSTSKDSTLNKLFVHKTPVKLNPAEREVILLYVSCFSVSEIAITMNMCEKRISAHKRSVMKKMGVSTDVALIQKVNEMLMVEKIITLSESHE